MAKIRVARGTQAAYNNLGRKDSGTFYVCTDSNNIYLGFDLIFQGDIFKYLTIDEYNNVVITTYGDLGTTVVLFSNYNTTYEVLNAIDSAVLIAYKFIRNINSGDITPELLASSNYRDAYCVNFAFTIGSGVGQVSNSLFVESCQNRNYSAESYIAVINTGTIENPVYKFTVLDIGSGGGGGGSVTPQDLLVKADKVNGATSGNFAGLDSTGNLTDSGYNYTSFATNTQAVPSGGTEGQVLAKKSNTDNDLEWVNQNSQVQSDWDELDSDNIAYIKNKPTIPDSFDWEEF